MPALGVAEYASIAGRLCFAVAECVG